MNFHFYVLSSATKRIIKEEMVLNVSQAQQNTFRNYQAFWFGNLESQVANVPIP